MTDTIPKEMYQPLAVLVFALGYSLTTWGAHNVFEGRDNNVPGAQELGLQQIKAGGNIAFLAPYIENGILPTPETMNHFASRWDALISGLILHRPD